MLSSSLSTSWQQWSWQDFFGLTNLKGGKGIFDFFGAGRGSRLKWGRCLQKSSIVSKSILRIHNFPLSLTFNMLSGRGTRIGPFPGLYTLLHGGGRLQGSCFRFFKSQHFVCSVFSSVWWMVKLMEEMPDNIVLVQSMQSTEPCWFIVSRGGCWEDVPIKGVYYRVFQKSQETEAWTGNSGQEGPAIRWSYAYISAKLSASL